MELQFSPLPLLFTFLLFLFMFLKKGKRPKPQKPTSKLPPGPWKMPVIGNMHQLLGPLPHQTLRDLAQKHGPLMHLSLGEISTIVVTSPAVARDVLKTHDLNFANRPQPLSVKIFTYDCTDIAFAPYGEYWRQLRKICTLELLSTKRVESFQHLREEEVSNLIRSIYDETDTPINFTQKIMSMTNNIIARAAFGKKNKDQEKFLSALRETVKLAGGFYFADLFPSWKSLHFLSRMKSRMEIVHRKMDEVFDDIIEDHRQKIAAAQTTRGGSESKVEDLVDVLLRIQQHRELGFPITTDNIKGVIFDIFIGGTETSSATLEWAMAELMKNPRVMEKAQGEVRQALNGKEKVDVRDTEKLEYMKLVIKETLRLHPPLALLVQRECRERCEIDGYEIPEKTRVIVNAWAIGRDPRNWDDAESFKPERFDGSSIDYKGYNFEFIPFGAGRRICPGMTFGLANLVYPLALLLYHFNWKLPSGMEPEDLDMTETFGASVTKRNNLYLHAFPFNSFA
ncbi:hypothetical protein MRB53_007240 [Persea americana]|uniref:Uncharacterized protein n=1 Tax=Persea americana TaxID=3435 RepID=A0ACC2MI98_PERAE|nr:hypothetical protein MRB53_007240 [Persea americana]